MSYDALSLQILRGVLYVPDEKQFCNNQKCTQYFLLQHNFLKMADSPAGIVP